MIKISSPGAWTSFLRTRSPSDAVSAHDRCSGLLCRGLLIPRVLCERIEYNVSLKVHSDLNILKTTD